MLHHFDILTQYLFCCRQFPHNRTAGPPAAIAMAPQRKLRILCFGDSLTSGYSGMGAIFHPYQETLEQMIAMAFPEYELNTVEDGKPGDLVTSRGRFLERMENNCESAFSKGD
jgi:hypothetical protein